MGDGMRYTDPNEPELVVTKYASLIPISEELLVDSLPFIGPERPPIVLTRRQKIRIWMSQTVSDIRLRVGSKIAGVDLEDRELD
jgi:hypothetical protein